MLRADKVDEWVEAHANVPPDVLAAIMDAGIRDYSVFLFGDRVFGTYECDDPEKSLVREAAAEATKRWRVAMALLFEEEVSRDGPSYLPEFFRLD